MTARRLYLEPAKRALPATGKKDQPQPRQGAGWDWSKGVPPRDVFVSMMSESGMSDADATVTWEKLNRGQANRG